MRYEAYLQALLHPLGIYSREAGGIAAAELAAAGAGLDAGEADALLAERECILATAQEEGLSRRESLFARRPAAPSTQLRRAAIAALMQIGGDTFSPGDINRTISGCGIRAEAWETEEPGHIRILFPDVSGVPPEFSQIEKIILDIIPCHLETEFYFRYLTWVECEAKGWTWETVEAALHSWESFELAV